MNASQRLQRGANALAILFPQLQANQLQSNKGLIESSLLTFNNPESVTGMVLQDKTLIKAGHLLPIAGSIRARGGIYEVLAFAEKVGIENSLISENDDLTKLVTPEAKAFFANYRVGVGSTGNLGLSIGLMASALGFQAIMPQRLRQDDKPYWRRKKPILWMMKIRWIYFWAMRWQAYA